MAQQAPKQGEFLVWPWAFDELRVYVEQDAPDMADLLPGLLDELTERVETGAQKYGTYLMTHNGRNAVQDAWEESADLFFYLTQALEEGDTSAASDITDVHALSAELLLKLTRMKAKRGR